MKLEDLTTASAAEYNARWDSIAPADPDTTAYYARTGEYWADIIHDGRDWYGIFQALWGASSEIRGGTPNDVLRRLLEDINYYCDLTGRDIY